MKKRWIVLSAAAALVVLALASPGGWLVASMIVNDLFGPKAPPIYANIKIPENADLEHIGRAFDAAVQRKYPPGSRADRLVADLTGQGFKHSSSETQCKPENTSDSLTVCPNWDKHWSPRNGLRYRWSRGPCGTTLDVIWSVDNSGRITHIEGSQYYVCL